MTVVGTNAIINGIRMAMIRTGSLSLRTSILLRTDTSRTRISFRTLRTNAMTNFVSPTGLTPT
jgi:hypothetical protein